MQSRHNFFDHKKSSSLDHKNEAAVDLHCMKIKVLKKFGQTISSVDVLLTLPYLTLPYLS